MFGEYEDTINLFLSRLRESDPDKFTDREWELVWAYTKSDGCTGVADIYVTACWEHDFYFRTHHDFCGHVISFWEANRKFRIRMQRCSALGVFSPVSWWRWLGVILFGKTAWEDKRKFML